VGKKKSDCCKKYKKGKQCKRCPRRRSEEQSLTPQWLAVGPALSAGENAD
jgi:hypothetical protein